MLLNRSDAKNVSFVEWVIACFCILIEVLKEIYFVLNAYTAKDASQCSPP